MANPGDILYAVPNELVNNLSFIVNVLQAVGVAILVYVIFNIINLFLARKKQREIQKINENLEDIKKILKGKKKGKKKK